MIDVKLKSNCDCNGFIFDGFPRTVAQAQALDKLMAQYNKSIAGMVALEVETQELINRLLERGKTSGRADDQDVSIIQNRIVIYDRKTAPLIDYYSAQHKFFPVEGVGTIAEITDRLIATISNF
jgi:adenylate kinase